ncbi:DUF6708 domain-containing protein [Halomonas sp. BN3-1]|uniref:DUF6708 domain-containing protein n=1 Tax=Halomonas sp. BN3-1 TaxID=2082393 RepID=UPI000D3B90D3|nr:DUF6708 domain-containing protein [Halomonas sp. BN3-1]
MINEYFTQLLYRDRGLDWFAEPLDIPVDDDIPFDLKTRATDEPYDAEFIYTKNDVFLETVNADEFCRRGMYTAMFGFLFGGLIPFAVLFFLEVAWDFYTDGLSVLRCVALFFCSVFIFFLSYVVCNAHSAWDCFTYRHAAIRFNRRTRQVHVFYTPKLGGPRSYDWDDILATITPFDNGGYFVLNIMAATPDGTRYYDSFPVGGELVKHEECLGWWEYIRRYMKEGPDQVPEPGWYHTDRLSLKESFLRWFPLREMKRDKARGHDIRYSQWRMVLMSPMLALFSLGHFVSMLTSRKVAWSKEIREACGKGE